jgi:hypothetical protein
LKPPGIAALKGATQAVERLSKGTVVARPAGRRP